MPFASPESPSIALTQLRSVLANDQNGQVECEIYYLNHDFVNYFGREIYLRISNSENTSAVGVGDWLFRSVAFPNAPENASDYLQRYGHLLAAERELLQAQNELRCGLDGFLDLLIQRYDLDGCSLVGFTSMFAQNTPSFAVARKLKSRNSNLVTVMGGANCETVMGGAIARNVQAIDFVFSGPSLKTFPRLVQYLMEGASDKCHEINGVFSKEKFRRNVASGANEIGEETDVEDEIPLDYDGFLASLDEKCPGTAPRLLFETSRGCWWGQRSQCTFCGLNPQTLQYTAMSPQRALRQFDDLFRYRSRVSCFACVDKILPREYLTAVLPRVKPPEKAHIFYEVKADLKDHEMQVLADAQVTEIQPGIESLATTTLKLMKKGTTSFQNIRLLKNCLVYGINPGWNLLVGFPGEPEAVYKKYVTDLPLLVHLPPPTGAQLVRFDRFSPYFRLAEDYGLKLRPYDFYAMVYPFPERDLEDLAYFFDDRNYENAYVASTGKWINKLKALVDHWHTRWHGRDGKPKPSLVFEWQRDARIVRDTRSGMTVGHDVGPMGVRLLECLAQPTRRSRLAEKLDDLSESDIDSQLEVLRTSGLIFEEGDRYLSLVVDYGQDEGWL